jgi:hypothetical protein
LWDFDKNAVTPSILKYIASAKSKNRAITSDGEGDRANQSCSGDLSEYSSAMLL